MASNCDDPPDPAGPIVIRYPHVDAYHVCGHCTLHTSKPVQAKKVWGKPCLPAARFLTYSDTHELELHGRSWLCRLCHSSGKQLMLECAGERPQPKPAFKFRTFTKKGVQKARGGRFGAAGRLLGVPAYNNDGQEDKMP